MGRRDSDRFFFLRDLSPWRKTGELASLLIFLSFVALPTEIHLFRFFVPIETSERLYRAKFHTRIMNWDKIEQNFATNCWKGERNVRNCTMTCISVNRYTLLVNRLITYLCKRDEIRSSKIRMEKIRFAPFFHYRIIYSIRYFCSIVIEKKRGGKKKKKRYLVQI